MSLKLGIDVGSGVTNYMGANVRGFLTSTVGKIAQLDSISAALGVNDCHVFQYGGELYVTGDSATALLTESELCPTTTDDFSETVHNKILLLSAVLCAFLKDKNGNVQKEKIDKLIADGTLTVSVGVGLPIAKFSTSKESYEASLVGSHVVTFIDGRTLEIVIDSAMVLPQAAASIYSLQSKYPKIDWSKRIVGICDVGTHTTGLAVFNNGVFSPAESAGFSNAGMMHMARMTNKMIDNMANTRLRLDRILRGFLNGEVMVNGKSINLASFTENLDPLTQEIKNFIRDTWDNANDRHVMVVGGGSTYFYPAIKKLIPHAELLDPSPETSVYAIVEGLYRHIED
jgi:hypothetical protein